VSGDLGEFLRSRRARIQPEDIGLQSHGRRRVPGLRREEVAQLAGVSVDYYIRLEQGRGQTVSDAVLDSVARVLRMDATERAHLRDLARPGRKTSGPQQRQQVRAGVLELLEMVGTAPAFVLGRCMDVLAWNDLGAAVVGFARMSPGEWNMARHAFLDPAARRFYLDWDAVAGETVAHLRLAAGRYPGDRQLADLVGELSAGSPDFARLWAQHPVKEKSHGTKRMRHPLVGDLTLGYETLALPGDPDQLLVVYTAPAGSVSADRLASLLAAVDA
jgi:transcriptional regulator with XRE-family HTH domain